ncbi:MAG: preprotein translocase subunit YajC [Rhodospirillaceae bacterium]|jgi:preprotein translocase subunit YajC|nr:preprotein translocase subunit YajC [Rhodospirillaceae bacterium]MBT6204582.1 preprotein translocase subunit YajC [Rhodospirillaceae bacterium]MBT6509211.1 preprotein translocase subunit YajC [Rhodospirillaceae bacterium]MBT7646265.1 preprotein translocase subunit YajC [Rhodospirillaceae bacterium]
MLISQAFAQDAGGAAPGFDPVFLVMMVGMFAVFWFLVIRPQSKRAKEHTAMLNAIKRGDQVVTNGGIIGRVARLEGDGVLIVEIAPEVKVKVRQSMISTLVTKSDPRPDDNGDDKDSSVKKDG